MEYVPAGVVCLAGGGGVPPPPPPDDEHAVKTGRNKKESASTGNSTRRLARRAHGSSMIASTGARGCQNPEAGRAADDDAWLVAICSVTLPVPLAGTVVLDGLNTHA